MREESRYFVRSLLIWLGLAYLTNAQSQPCPPITINDLGNTTSFSRDGLVAEGIVPPGEADASIPVRIMNYTIVCDTSGDRRDTSSYVSVVVQFQCNYSSTNPTLTVCDGSTIVTRQYQFQCIIRDGQLVWGASVSGDTFFVQILNPTATLSTPLANQCRRCIDDQQSSSPNINATTHCDPCGSQCNQGQRRCFIGPEGDECCNFYLEGRCVAECPSNLTADSNFDCVCPLISLDNGDVTYSPTNRDIGSVATHTCNTGYRPSPQETQTCTSNNGWDGQDVTCVLIMCPDLTIANGLVTISPPGRRPGSMTFYECGPGFVLVGDGNRVCQENSSWSGDDPKCNNCFLTLRDPNCEECGFDSNDMPICIMCKGGYSVVDGQCEIEREDPTSGVSRNCLNGILLTITLMALCAILE